MFKKIIILAIRTYQKTLSPDQGVFKKAHPTCRFYPTCSQYTIEAVQKYGALKGCFLAGARILKCHPWHPGGYDPLK